MVFPDWGQTSRIIEQYRIGDLASISGVIISIIGFIVTIINVRRSRKAIQKAEDAVIEVRNKIMMSNIIADLSSAIALLDEVKILHRQGILDLLPGKYTTIKTRLIEIKNRLPKLSPKNKTIIQNAITHFGDIEEKIEQAIASQQTTLDVPTVNRIISKQMENLSGVLITIKTYSLEHSDGL